MSRSENKKRHNSQPLGGAAKDARSGGEGVTDQQSDQQNEDFPPWSEVARGGRGGGRGALPTFNRFGLLTQANSYPDRTMRSASVSSRGSRRGYTASRTDNDDVQTTRDQELTYSESSLGAASRFVTPAPDGAYRDDFAIEFQQINGRPFRGSITVKEARDTVFRDTLGFNPSLLHSIRPVFGGATTIRFKLKEQINMDNLASVEYFDLRRTVSPTRTDIISCRIMGIRGMQAEPNYDGTANDVRWVKIENCEYLISNEKIGQWMELFGQPLSLLGEDKFPDSDSEGGPLGNGTYSIKMKLARDIPQFLPMHGRKIRVYFKNMNKLCTNCYGSHTRRQCTNEKVPWITYVRDFMKQNPDIPEDYNGKWWEVVDQEYPGYFDDVNDDESLSNQANANENSNLNQEMSNPTVETGTLLNKQNPVPGTSGLLTFRPRDASILSTSNATRLAPQKRVPYRQSRDPRIQKQHQDQHDQAELATLMQKGLSIDDAVNYIKSKKEQYQIEQRMSNQTTTQSQNTDTHGPVPRMISTKIGPGSSRGGRGGLSFN